MANEEHVELLMQGLALWQEAREQKGWRPDLSGADLRLLHLEGYDLSQADLSGANMHGAKLSQANLSYSFLTGANLSFVDARGALLQGARLRGANLRSARFAGANLSGAELSKARLDATDFSGAILDHCEINRPRTWLSTTPQAQQQSLYITDAMFFKKLIAVDTLQAALYIDRLLRYRKFRNVCHTALERCVLLLGRPQWGNTWHDLHTLATWLREQQYVPVVVDLVLLRNRDYAATMRLVARQAHYILVDLRRDPLEADILLKLPPCSCPIVPLIKRGVPLYEQLCFDLQKQPSTLKPALAFDDCEELLELLAVHCRAKIVVQ